MYKELLEKAKENNIDALKLYVAYVCSMNMSVDEEDFDDVCEATIKMFAESEEEENIIS